MDGYKVQPTVYQKKKVRHNRDKASWQRATELPKPILDNLIDAGPKAS